MMTAVLKNVRVPRAGKGRPRTRPDRVLADKGYPSKANRAWLRDRRIAATIPERNDQIAHRRKKPGRPIDFGDQQQVRYKGRNVVERCFNRLKQCAESRCAPTSSPATIGPPSASPRR